MDTKIFSLNCYGNTSGYASLSPSANGTMVCFNLKNAPSTKLTCLYFEDTLHLVGYITKSSHRVCKLLPVRGIHPSFGVFSGNDCIMFSGTDVALGKMNSYACSVISQAHTEPASSAQPPEITPRPSYYLKNKLYFDNLFSSCEHAKALEQLIPDSKWVFLPDDCILGIINAPDSSILYICYGTKGTKNQTLPDDLINYCLFIPDPADPLSGWWTVYQDPCSGDALPLK